MMKHLQNLFLVILMPVFTLTVLNTKVTGQRSDYRNHQQMSQDLQNLAQQHPQYTKLQSLVRTAGNKEIWLLTIGTGDIKNKPAIAVVGGTAGDHLLGSELAIQFAMQLLNNRHNIRIRNLLDSVVFFIFPDMTPDAREQYFAPLRYQRLGNASSSDWDRDGKTGEDPYNDLNRDGLITLMRIADPTGRWIPHPEDERIMIQARPEMGEKGRYIVLSEGIDDDKDGLFNEDGPEGVIFNRNFTFRYPVFSTGAGPHAVSEAETRAIADFLYIAKNVFAVVSFGDANNLSAPENFSDQAARARIPYSWQEKDVKANEMVSHFYYQQLDTLAPRAIKGSDGDFFQWAYYHYGRFSFSTQGWTVPEQRGNGAFYNEEFNFLNWAENHNLMNVFVPWTPVQHPDFPGRQVEVGGIVPFAMKNPPYHLVATLAEKHYLFLMHLAELRPRIEIVNIEKEQLGRNLFRITLDISNTGALPATTQMGQRVRWVQKPVVRLQTGRNQSVVSGATVEIMDTLDARSAVKRSWIIQGSGTVKIRAGAESTGFAETEIRL
jgi:hypothetical protein